MFFRISVRSVIPVLFFCLAAISAFQPACIASRPVEININTITDDFTGNIYIGGEVNSPGLYPFSPDDSLGELIMAAGGLRSGADISQVSLIIPDPSSASLPQHIDINRAEAWLLAALPGIGDTRAQDIVDYRQQNGPFRSASDLLNVKGIGQATLDRIKDLITVSE